LEFLGEVDTNRADELSAAVRLACAGTSPLKLNLEGPGCFPSFQKPSVVWLGVGGNVERLARLQAEIRRNVQSFGDRQDNRPFSAHLTIGRVKSGAFKTARVFGKSLEGEFKKIGNSGEWLANFIQIMRSDLSSAGPRYSELARIEL
jgi:2'-5' RNA ligase